MKSDDYDNLKIILWLILFLVFGIVIITCKPATREFIMTVNGPESPGKMGITLEHEHILVDFIGADSTGYFRWDREKVINRIVPYITDTKQKGVNTFIECTPAYLGRDPLLLRELSSRTGMIFITNTGYYGARDNLFLPRDFYSLSASQLAQEWIGEFENGIEDTGIRPGFIKIGVNPGDTLSEEHKKLITAAALAHLKTGMTVASHTGPDKPAMEQIDILRENGVDPSAFIWVHAQSGTPEGNIKAARKGAWISLDNVHAVNNIDGTAGTPLWYAERIDVMRQNGLLGKVLISHDSGWYDPARPEGGDINGFTAIFDYLIPVLKTKNFSDNEIEQILVRNPQEAFKISIRKL